jgi:hypothetical protein
MRNAGSPYLVPVIVAAFVACGLPGNGLAPNDAGADGYGPPDAGSSADGPVADDGGPSTGDDASDADASADDASQLQDSPGPDGLPCTSVDAGILGQLSLAGFTTAGVAQYDEYGDGMITLTQAASNLAGAAWYSQQLPVVTAYDLTWTLREGPNDVAGAGFTFAVLGSNTAPSATFVGNNGDAMGLKGIAGKATGYAVGLYLYGGINLEILSMPKFQALASQTSQASLNDGNDYAVDVSWRAPSTLTATLHGPNGPITVTSSDPSLAAPGPAWFGVTASTGPASNSHNELAGIAVTDACE